MNRLKSMTAIAAIFLLHSCATIKSNSNQPLSVSTDPQGAEISVVGSNGTEVFNGTSPASMNLNFSAKDSYTVTIKKDGFEPKKVNVECRNKGWYSAKGATHKLDKNGIKETLESCAANTSPSLLIDMSLLNKEREKYLLNFN